MPHSPKPPRVLLPCPQCSKKFGKQTKLDSHLLQDHDATLRLSPGVLSPPRSPSDSHEAVRSLLTAALDEANRVFQVPGAPVCSICPNSRAFRNKRDLAQHYVSKHSDFLGMEGEVAVSVMPMATNSQTSVNPLKRSLENVGPAMKKVKIEKEELKLSPAAKEVTLSPTINTVSTSPKKEVKLSPAKTIAKATGSKPPVTPKRTQKAKAVEAPKTSAMRKAADAKTTTEVTRTVTPNPVMPQPISFVPVIPAAMSRPLDFSSMGGFATNARKSYYKLANR